jgi:hypothetical protein
LEHSRDTLLRCNAAQSPNTDATGFYGSGNTQIRNGARVRVNAHKKLAPIGPAYPDKKSVEPLAWKHLEPINTRLQTPESDNRIHRNDLPADGEGIPAPLHLQKLQK